MKKTRSAIAVGVAVLLGAGAIGAAAAAGGAGDDADEHATGPAADRAARAAEQRFPGARVTAVEQKAEGTVRWEAEVTRPNGTTLDVALDQDYRIVEANEESATDDNQRDDLDQRDDDDRGGGDDERRDDDEPGDDDERADDDDVQAGGDDARRAGAAALARFPGGRVTSVEREAEDTSAWEVEVTRGDGTRVDVDLDAQLQVIAVGDPE
jgi:uncharacterized membrane protein YkoI